MDRWFICEQPKLTYQDASWPNSNPGESAGEESIRMIVILKRCQIVVHLVHGSLSPLFSCHPLAFKPSLSHYNAVEFAEPMAQAYRRRWGIETSYRKVREFLPKTTSPTFSVRLFYFLFAVALYNLWILVNLLLTQPHARECKPPIPTAIFREFLGVVPHG